jgi:hypothetical protein
MHQRHVSRIRLTFALVLVAAAFTTAAPPTISEAKRDSNGALVHTVESEQQDAVTKIKVLVPGRLVKERRYPVVYLLPVEAGEGARFGDGLTEVKNLDLHNKHDVVCVAPTFARLPWYADHPTNMRLRQETYFREVVVPFVEKTYPVVAKPEGRLLLGFSKSGWGAWTILLRHPEEFGKAVAWDAPLMMEAPGRYGSGEIFGTAENFAKYHVTKLLEQNGGKLSEKKRLVLLGYGSFRKDHQDAHALMEKWKVAHIYEDGPRRKHDWHSGWVAEAMQFLVAR